MASNFNIPDPHSVDLTTATTRDIVCYLNSSENEYNGGLGSRISSIFVIGLVSSFATAFPVMAQRLPRLRMPLYAYLFARCFGSGVIVATAFIHLLDPAYASIGPATCVGMTGGWTGYSWPPAFMLVTCMGIFLMDVVCCRYVEMKYGIAEGQRIAGTGQSMGRGEIITEDTAETGCCGDGLTRAMCCGDAETVTFYDVAAKSEAAYDERTWGCRHLQGTEKDEEARRFAVKQQLGAFLILEFGIIFHSVIIGLNLGVAGEEFSVLYAVLVFHQSFEGLGIGARLSTIPFRTGSWTPWILCAAYGITTPVSTAAGLGVRTTYNSGSYTANVVSGVLDSISAGVLIYTGLVELLARDFIFNPSRTKNSYRLAFMVVSVFVGAGIMALLAKWA